jgi:hypothetical protein
MTPMTPDKIKRKYQDMLNNEVLAADPIAWMHDDSEFIVMTAASHGVNGCGYAARYRKVARCEVQKGVTPKMISERANGMRFIWELHDHLYKGGSKSAYEIMLTGVIERCARLNAKVARLNALHAKPQP